MIEMNIFSILCDLHVAVKIKIRFSVGVIFIVQ